MPMSKKEKAAIEAEWLANKPRKDTLQKIADLEAQITSRRVREAILGADGGWLSNQEGLIAAERAKL